MTRNSLRTRNDGPPEWSTIIMLAALPAALAALLYSPAFNGLSVVAIMLVVGALARRVAEIRRRKS